MPSGKNAVPWRGGGARCPGVGTVVPWGRSAKRPGGRRPVVFQVPHGWAPFVSKARSCVHHCKVCKHLTRDRRRKREDEAEAGAGQLYCCCCRFAGDRPLNFKTEERPHQAGGGDPRTSSQRWVAMGRGQPGAWWPLPGGTGPQQGLPDSGTRGAHRYPPAAPASGCSPGEKAPRTGGPAQGHTRVTLPGRRWPRHHSSHFLPRDPSPPALSRQASRCQCARRSTAKPAGPSQQSPPAPGSGPWGCTPDTLGFSAGGPTAAATLRETTPGSRSHATAPRAPGRRLGRLAPGGVSGRGRVWRSVFRL